ncbi:asparagine synthase (glutamine-hydrolyzing) [Flavihumibacter sp. UBA7668]|uniref:asparagine synthase (glutamine-hydrolyzing) n=1 Tax=Flavihumibacter sp. UBA7668 TaxID=1946542 RepID=UPI0025C58496|nr:asparagine synthase (glutamine-hydrolyzing) [Flavihumibacter sp. UBA7668]
MCGIAGIITEVAASDADRQFHAINLMAEALAHRGPDGAGFWEDDSARVFFGHRRLSVIDLSPGAAQPMHYAGRFTILYNGEIYNYKELRTDLLHRGYTFQTESDTEVILAAYQEFGADCVKQLDGMFAFAIWDAVQSELFLARDRMGEKPLFFCWQGGRLLFASEMKAFWAVGVPKEPDPHQLLLYLGAGVTGIPLRAEQSFYSGIFQLPPAHTALYSYVSGVWGELILSRYWDLTRPVPPDRCHPTGDHLPRWMGEFEDLLKASVRKRLRSDVPVGSSLSGGVDSSSIAAMVKELGVGKWTGFSAVFPGFERDESALIGELASRLNIQSQTCTPTAADLLKDLDRLLFHQEMPVESASALVQYKVMQLAAEQGVTVLLDGQGADELLGGYPSYIHWFLQEKWRSGPRAAFLKERTAFTEHGWKEGWGWRNRLAAWFPQAAQEQLIKKQAASVRRIPYVNQEYVSAALRTEDLFKPFVTSLNDILYFDLTMGRLPELLRYADRNSMAFGREIRLPYLDPALMEFVFSLPAEFKMRDGYTKWILRQSMNNRLPASIAWQKKKIGYEPPQTDWMKAPGVQEFVLQSRQELVDKGILQKRYLDRPYTGTAADWRVLVLGRLIAQ